MQGDEFLLRVVLVMEEPSTVPIQSAFTKHLTVRGLWGGVEWSETTEILQNFFCRQGNGNPDFAEPVIMKLKIGASGPAC